MRRAGAEHGFSLISAIFVLVFVSLTAAAMLNLVATERRSASMAILGTRALHAASAGVDWAVAKIAATPTACPAASFTLSEGALSGFDVSVTCSFTEHVEDTRTVNTFRITSSAELGSHGDADHVSRSVQATIVGEP